MDENETNEVEESLVPETHPPARERDPIPWAAVILVIWAVLVIVFAVQNADDVIVEFLSWNWEVPLSLVILVTALITLVVSAVWFAFYRRKLRRRRDVREETTSDD